MSPSRTRRLQWEPALNVVTSIVIMACTIAAVVILARRSYPPPPPPHPVPAEALSVEHGARKGSPSAPVVMIAFSDFECPYCGRFAREVLPTLEKEYFSVGHVQLVFRHLPLPSHSRAVSAAQAAECAGAQGRFWPMHDELFAQGVRLHDHGLRTIAASLHLDEVTFGACLEDEAILASVSRDADQASALGLRSTPAFLLGSRRADGLVQVMEAFTGALPVDVFRTKLNQALGRRGGWFGWFALLGR
jgi:protein-disulfide isomerase